VSAVTRVELTAKLIEAFAGTFLSPLYDNPQPTPQLHRDCWELYCSGTERLHSAKIVRKKMSSFFIA